MSGNHLFAPPVCTLTGFAPAARREGLRSAIAIVLFSLCAAAPLRAQEPPFDGFDAPRMAGADGKQDDSADDPESEAEVEKSAAELEAVRKAEEKAGLVPQAPGTAPRDSIALGLDPSDPLAPDLAAAVGTGPDGPPPGGPAPPSNVAGKVPRPPGPSEKELRAQN